MNTIVLKRKKNGWSYRKQSWSQRETKTEADLHKEKLNFINYAREKSLDYWKSVALKKLIENEARELIELAPRKVILVSKAKNQKFDNIEEIIFYLKS